MTAEQRRARNEAYHLLSIAERIMGDAGLTGYAQDIGVLLAGLKYDAEMLQKQELNRRIDA